LLALSAFNLLLLCIIVSGTYKLLFGKVDEEKDKGRQILKRLSTHSTVDMLASMTVSERHTTIYAATRMLTLAHKAQRRIKARQAQEKASDVVPTTLIESRPQTKTLVMRQNPTGQNDEDDEISH